MKRRKFIENSAMLALTVGVFGKIKWDGEKYVGTDPTTTDILGPFYRPGAPFKTNLIQPGTKGETLYFSGTIFGKDGKSPVNGALVEICIAMKMVFTITLLITLFIVLLPKPLPRGNTSSKQ